MTESAPRLRMFAGPNGSGKSTVKDEVLRVLGPSLIGVDINPDVIEQHVRDCGFLDLAEFGVTAATTDAVKFVRSSSLIKRAGLWEEAALISASGTSLQFGKVKVNSYYASALCAFIRGELIANRISFTCETVMSHKDKIELLQAAHRSGFRNYLYYVATEDPAINVDRVANRVKLGGHSVPADKIVSRYKRSLELLADAIRETNRAYIFDNSRQALRLIAEITGGSAMDKLVEDQPTWFRHYVLDRVS